MDDDLERPTPGSVEAQVGPRLGPRRDHTEVRASQGKVHRFVYSECIPAVTTLTWQHSRLFTQPRSTVHLLAAGASRLHLGYKYRKHPHGDTRGFTQVRVVGNVKTEPVLGAAELCKSGPEPGGDVTCVSRT